MTRSGRTRIRRVAHNVAPSAGQPGSRSTAKPSLLASQHRQSHRPGGASPGGEGIAAWAGRGCPVVWDRSQTKVTWRAVRQLRSGSSSSRPQFPSCWRGLEKISMPFSSRRTCLPVERHASYRFTSVAVGIRDEMSRMFAQLSPGSCAAACRHRVQSPAVRISWAVSCRRTRSAASLLSRSSARLSWSSELARIRRAITRLPMGPRPAEHAAARDRLRRTASEGGRWRR